MLAGELEIAYTAEVKIHGAPILTASLVLILFAGFFFFPVPPKASSAKKIVEKCKDTEDRAACYESAVPDLYPSLSLQEIFGVIREIRHIDHSYQFCHVLAHKVGERVVADDPDNWIDAIPLNPADGLCSNGFIHGVVGGRFRAEVLSDDDLKKLVPDFSRACESRPHWQPSDLDRSICYHGLGHLYDFITDADLPKALSLCEETAAGKDHKNDFRRVCREGVFMQIYQPLEPDDFLMIERMPIKPSTTTVRSFCARFERDEYEGACLRESWPFSKDMLNSAEGTVQFCARQPNPTEETACYESMTSLLGRRKLSDHNSAASICAGLPPEPRRHCYTAVARAVLEEDRTQPEAALSFCARAPEKEAKECVAQLVSEAHFLFGTNESQLRAFCRLVPEEMSATCKQ